MCWHESTLYSATEIHKKVKILTVYFASFPAAVIPKHGVVSLLIFKRGQRRKIVTNDCPMGVNFVKRPSAPLLNEK